MKSLVLFFLISLVALAATERAQARDADVSGLYAYGDCGPGEGRREVSLPPVPRLQTWSVSQKPDSRSERTDAGTTLEVRDLPHGSGALLAAETQYARGAVYLACAEIVSRGAGEVEFSLRGADAPWERGGVANLRFDEAGAHRVTIVGGFQRNIRGQVALRALRGGDYAIRDLRLFDVTADALRRLSTWFPSARSGPREFIYGIHINKLGAHHTWPPVAFNGLRLWDTGTTWDDVRLDMPRGSERETKRRDRFALYVKHVRKHCPDCTLMYTAAVTPLELARDRRARFIGQRGSSSPPADLSHWRAFIEGLLRSHGRDIEVLEVWNEADSPDHFRGSADELATMTREAADVARRLAPRMAVTYPNVTISGLYLVDQVLDRLDDLELPYVSLHFYPDLQPEAGLPQLLGLRDVLLRHGRGDVPIVNTESRLRMSDEAGIAGGNQPGAVARAYLMQVALGFRGLYWYVWDDETSSNSGKLFDPSGERYTRGNANAAAITAVQRWMRDVDATSVERVTDSEAGRLWVLRLDRGAQVVARVAWLEAGAVGAACQDMGLAKGKTYEGLDGRQSRNFADCRVGREPVHIGYGVDG